MCIITGTSKKTQLASVFLRGPLDDEVGKRDEYITQLKKQAKDFALYLINDGKTDAEIISVTHLSEDEVKNLRAEN